MENAPAVVEEERSIADVAKQVGKIQELMRSVMHSGEHYGVIPGTGDKPSLLKPGAEKLCFVFRLAPEYVVDVKELAGGHREYSVRTILRNMATGNKVGEGVGSCSTMESKYRYRNASDYEVTDQPIPKDSKEHKAEYRKQGFGMKKVDGEWVWVRYKSDGKVENPDIADVYNTVLKMAKKRSLVDATITACAASDIFTQDVEDMVEPEPPMRRADPAPEEPPVNLNLSGDAPEEPPVNLNLSGDAPEGDREACLRLAHELGKTEQWLKTMKATSSGDYSLVRKALEDEKAARGGA